MTTQSVGQESINKAEWDYTQHAEFYRYRPNYAPAAIDQMLRHANARSAPDYVVADVGAGTGNLTIMLLERGMKCIAVEPNASMRNIGIEVTRGKDVEWRVGTGETTSLAAASVDLFTMGSSFNTTDRERTLAEADRVLKPGGWFVCMWNHRDLNDESQQRAEGILKEFFPDYSHGTRREDQSDILRASTRFGKLHYIESTQEVNQKLVDYIAAWKSVKNRFWDLATDEGRKTFSRIEKRLSSELDPILVLHYTTRLWMVQKK